MVRSAYQCEWTQCHWTAQLHMVNVVCFMWLSPMFLKDCFKLWSMSPYYMDELWDVYIASKCMHAKLLQPCLTLCHSLDHSLPGSSVHGLLHIRILEWVAIASYRGSSWARNRTMPLVSCIGRWVLYHQCHLGSPASKYLSTNYLLTIKGRILIVTLVWKISNRYCLIQATKLTSPEAGQVKTTRVLDDALRNHISIMWAETTPRTQTWIESRGNISKAESRESLQGLSVKVMQGWEGLGTVSH